MDIWRWLRDRRRELLAQGHSNLAASLSTLLERVDAGDHEGVDALFPEALALARAAGDPWIELFVRHWNLQSLVLQRMYGERALSEAVSLVDFSHRPETEGCPQSVCSVQDLSVCFGIVDGPGFVPERLEVTAETLARIDPGWACFQCISGEYASALRDAGRFEEEYAFIERQRAAARAYKPSADPDGFLDRTRIGNLMELGRHEEALSLLRSRLAQQNTRRSSQLGLRMQRSLCLAHLGRFSESLRALPKPSEIDPRHYHHWITCAQLFVRHGARRNDAALGREVREMVATLDRHGAVRATVCLAQIEAELALDRGAVWTARRALARIERAVPRLHRTLDALDRARAVRSAIERAEHVAPLALPEDPDTLLAALRPSMQSPDDAEKILSTLERAVERWPAHSELARAFSLALDALGAGDEAPPRGTTQTEGHPS
jgi:tetratricopeptide (TPR) repeat protein